MEFSTKLDRRCNAKEKIETWNDRARSREKERERWLVRTLIQPCTCARQNVLLPSTSQRTFLAGLWRLKAEKTSDAARVSFDRDIRFLVGKTPTSYYGLFWALPTLWYYNYAVIDKLIKLPPCEPPSWRSQCPEYWGQVLPARLSTGQWDGGYCSLQDPVAVTYTFIPLSVFDEARKSPSYERLRNAKEILNIHFRAPFFM